MGADQVTLNLDGHRIFGSPIAQSGQYAGVLVSGHTGVTVTGGQIDHFSGGVVLVNTTHTTVSNMVIRDNVGTYDLLAYGDGVALFYSSHNTITANKLIGNGTYDNMSVLGRLSDYNLIQNNLMADNVSIDNGGITGIGENLHSNAFADPNFPDRGASLVGNQIIGNTMLRAYANGISNLSNTQAQIINNTVKDSGQGDPNNGYGIGIQHLNAATFQTQDLVQGNTVLNNSQNGIFSSAFANRYIANTALGNGFFQFASSHADLYENTQNGACVNVWLGNTYNYAAPACTTLGGHHINPPPTPPGPVVSAHAAPRKAAPTDAPTRTPYRRGN
ncbi:MAG: right-handed parallel beta-helix repeat-containing protein [Actinomycetota bacterium]|nr:right-handed parallel beta-helix repeat-containing protein [Actinomycetota bacterium]MDQ6946478.1 right-handed parallel beta-helix repeat-containing protein [Actinomycetota bacterium]